MSIGVYSGVCVFKALSAKISCTGDRSKLLIQLYNYCLYVNFHALATKIRFSEHFDEAICQSAHFYVIGPAHEILNVKHTRIQRGGGQRVRTPPPPPPPPINHKAIGFLCNTGSEPWKITKLPNQHSILGHHRLASETPFKWPAFSHIWILSPLFNWKNKQKKNNVVRVGLPLTKLSGSAHVKASYLNNFCRCPDSCMRLCGCAVSSE